ELERVLLLVEDVSAGHVGRHEVRRELDALEPAAQHLPERTHEQRLAEPWHSLDEHVSAREDRDQRVLDGLVLSHQRASDLAGDALEPHRKFLNVPREPPFSCKSRPSSRTIDKSSCESAPAGAAASRADCASTSSRRTSVSDRPVLCATASARP